jgi:fatty acid desaturase
MSGATAIPDDDALRTRVRRLSALRSDAAGLRQLALHLALLAATGALVLATRGSLWLLPAMLAHGIVLVFLFCPLHEASHRSAFRSRRLNDAVAWLGGGLLLMAPTWFRHYHMAHHRWTQDPQRDPELETPKPATPAAWAWHVSGLPLWRALAASLVRLAAGRADFAYLPARDRRRAVREARWLLAVYGAIAVTAAAAQSWLPLVLWVGPALLGQPALRLFLLAEHGGCPHVEDMFANTRTTLTNRAMRKLCWNMNLHAEHHAYPSVPFFALPEVHGLVRERLQVTAPGYAAANAEILRGITAGASRPARPAPRPPRAAS